MNKRNGSTIQYRITEDGFSYHIKKFCLKQGSTISKKLHPVKQVEDLKAVLLTSKKIIDKGSCYVCRCNIKTGLLMAYNLHKGILIEELPSNSVVTINGAANEDEEIKEFFEIRNCVAADNVFLKGINKDTYIVDKVIEAEYDDEFFERSKTTGFSNNEQFVVDVLKDVGELGNYRRGDANKHESDIVDEEGKRQIEIVCMYDEKIPMNVRNRGITNKMNGYLLEFTDIGINKISDGVINKFTKKTYVDNLSKELAVYIMGTNNQAAKQLETIKSRLKESTIKNDFKSIHFIVHDPLITETITYCNGDRKESFSDRDMSFSPVIRRICGDQLLDDKFYFVTMKNIFNGDIQMAWLLGREINIFLTTYYQWGK